MMGFLMVVGVFGMFEIWGLWAIVDGEKGLGDLLMIEATVCFLQWPIKIKMHFCWAIDCLKNA